MGHPPPDTELRVRIERLLARARGKVLDVAVEGLTGEEGSFDTVVCHRVLCTVDDLNATLVRIAQLMKPDGQLLAIEHVRGTGTRARSQDLSAPLWRRIAGGCHPNRDPVGAMREAGFAVTDCDRFTINRRTPIVAPHISAVAIRRAHAAPEGDV